MQAYTTTNTHTHPQYPDAWQRASLVKPKVKHPNCYNFQGTHTTLRYRTRQQASQSVRSTANENTNLYTLIVATSQRSNNKNTNKNKKKKLHRRNGT